MKNIQKITLVLLIATLIPAFVSAAEQVTIDYATKRWSVPDNLYGAHVGGFGGASMRLDAAPVDGREDILSDYQAHRRAMDEAKVNYIRRDMDLNNVINEDLTFNKYRNNPANINIAKSQVAWAAASNKKILLETTFMPDWLATKNAQCASNPKTCEPDNYAEWGRVVNAYLDEVGCDDHPGTCEVEIWNEPYLPQFFLSDGTCQQRIDAYIRLYTNTYASIKAKYPNMRIGGPSGFIGFTCSRDLLTQFMQKVPASKVDFITFHSYADNTLSQQITDTMNLIRANGHGKEVKITEFGAASASIETSQPVREAFILTSAYVVTASSEPTLTSLVKFQWSDDNKYSDGKPYFAHWPWKREMFSEAALENKKFASFEVSKDMGTMHPAGSTVVRTTSSSDLLSLATVSANGRYVTLVNRHWAPKTAISIEIDGLTATELRDVETGTIYPIRNGVASIGDVAATSVRSFEVVGGGAAPAPTPTPPPAPKPTPTPVPPPAPVDPSLTPSFTVAPNANSDLSVVQFEAEHGVQEGTLKTQVVLAAGAVTVPNTVFGEGTVDYKINVPATDSYVLWGRTFAPNYNDDSFYVSIDGGQEILWDIPISSGWNWNKVSARGENRVRRFTLSKGVHTITLRSRENGAAVEEWAISNDDAYLPTAR